jgi:hypothetical protein
VFLKGKTVFCTSDIEALRVYSPNGKIMIIPPIETTASHTVTIDDKKLPLHSGCYFLQIVSKKNGKRRFDVIPYIK